MQTIQPAMHAMTVTGIDIDYSDEAKNTPLPHYITMPLIGLTSIGLWLLIYKIGCGVVALLT